MRVRWRRGQCRAFLQGRIRAALYRQRLRRSSPAQGLPCGVGLSLPHAPHLPRRAGRAQRDVIAWLPRPAACGKRGQTGSIKARLND